MSQPFESANPRSTIPSAQRDFNGGRTGHSARQTESTLSCLAASERFKTTIPIGRTGKPEEIAAAAVFLASEESRFITGIDLPVDGGVVAV